MFAICSLSSFFLSFCFLSIPLFLIEDERIKWWEMKRSWEGIDTDSHTSLAIDLLPSTLALEHFIRTTFSFFSLLLSLCSSLFFQFLSLPTKRENKGSLCLINQNNVFLLENQRREEINGRNEERFSLSSKEHLRERGISDSETKERITSLSLSLEVEIVN